MPLYYRGILEEHAAVRQAVGLFDVSHMGILTVSGEHAPALLSRRTTCDATRVLPGQCRYAFWLNVDGMILDDLLLSRLDDGVHGPPRFLVVPNAGRADRVFDLLRQHRRPDTEVSRHNRAVSILAVQGPRSRPLLEKRFGWALGGLRFYTGRFFPSQGGTAASGALGSPFPGLPGGEYWVSRTGYTGEAGYEIFLPGGEAPGVAESLASEAVPCGLGARDTLRLEKGYLLSGNEFNLDRTPFEAGQERFVEMAHTFVGQAALAAQQARGPAQRLVGLELREPGSIPRHGMPVLHGPEPVGAVTSGGLSPTLGYGIALAYVPAALAATGTEFTVPIRARPASARVVQLPFLEARRAPAAY